MLSETPPRLPIPRNTCQTSSVRNLIATLCLTIAVLLGSAGVSWSADFQKGLTAYESGDFATALREWTPLAEQGHASAQSNLGNGYNKGQGVIQYLSAAWVWAGVPLPVNGAFDQSVLN